MRTAYDEIVEDSADEGRSRERGALRFAIEAMEEADRLPDDAGRRVHAILVVSRLWTTLLEDLASPENGYPDELRAQLISIGIFILRQCEALRQDRSRNFGALVEICRIIEEGLA